MKTSEDLFDLIRALNSHEKGYFRRYASLHVRGDKNRYMLLFEAIAKQKEYNEEKLKFRFRKEPFVRQFPVAKNYLYHQILKALRSYHYSIHSEIKDLQHEVEILIEKGLYSQAHKVLKKAKQLAKKNELHWATPEIEGIWETKLAVAANNMDWLKNVISDKTKGFQLLQNTEEYRDLNLKMFILYAATGKARGKQELEEMKRIIRLRQMRSESSALTFDARLRFLLTHALWADVQGNSGRYFSLSRKVIDLFKAHPDLIPYHLSSYIAYYGNVIGAAMNSKQYPAAGEYLNELKQLAPLTKNDMLRHKLFYYESHLTLNYFNTVGRFPGEQEEIHEIIRNMPPHLKYLNDLQKSVLFLNLATAFFIQEQYTKSIFWLNSIRNEISLSNYPNIQSFFRIFYLIVNYEAGKTDLLSSLLQSAYRSLKKSEHLYKFESIILSFFRNDISKINKGKYLISAFEKLKAKIAPLEKDPYEKNAFSYFDYAGWLESKIRRRSFAEVVREKAKIKS